MAKTLILFILCLLFPFNAFATVPTLETDAGAATLRITDGTSGDPVTWNDVWAFDGGSGNGDVPKDGGGTAKVSTFMTETVADAVYIILKDVDFGNDAEDATYFLSKWEMIYFVSGYEWLVKTGATLAIGILRESKGTQGSKWSLAHGSNATLTSGGAFYLYGSTLEIRDQFYVYHLSGGDMVFKDSTISNPAWYSILSFESGLSSFDIQDIYFSETTLRLKKAPTNMEKISSHHASSGIYISFRSNVVSKEMAFTDSISEDIHLHTSANFQLVDPISPPTSFKFDTAGSYAIEQYTVNIHITDKNGDDIETANVVCTDEAGSGVFDVNTDASGDIAEQTVNYQRWDGTSEVLTEYSPHDFTISKAGYRTVQINYNFSDGKVDWEIELDDGDTVIYDSTIYDSTIY